jgi:hypothetical protein
MTEFDHFVEITLVGFLISLGVVIFIYVVVLAFGGWKS